MLRPGLIRLVTLDLTNTVIKVKGGVGNSYKRVGHTFGIFKETPSTTIDAVFLNNFRRQWKAHPNFGHGHMLAGEWWEQVTVATVHEVVHQCHHQNYLDTSVILKFSQVLYDHFSKPEAYELLPEVSATLLQLTSVTDLGVITNNDSRIKPIIQELLPPDIFKFVIISNEEGSAKPDPQIFLRARELSRLSFIEILHVGDSYSKDYLPAVALGMQSLLVSKDNSHSGLHHVIPSVQNLVGVFNQLC